MILRGLFLQLNGRGGNYWSLSRNKKEHNTSLATAWPPLSKVE